MIRIAIVEDDKNYQQELLAHLKTYEKENNEKFQISIFSDGDEIVEDYNAEFDLILMDIEMRFMDGMSAAEEIRKVDSEVVIIFITNMPQYAMKGYEVEALDYVLKPLTYFALARRIEKAIARIQKRTHKYLSIPIKGGIQKISVAKLSYVEIRDHDLIFHTLKETYYSKGTLGAIEEMLEGQNFFRCNKCYLVNLEYIEGLKNNEVIIGDEVIQVSRAKKKKLLDVLNQYMSEVSR